MNYAKVRPLVRRPPAPRTRILLKLQRDGRRFLIQGRGSAFFTTAGFARLVERAGAEPGFEFKAHAHMLRHACGYKLVNDGARLVEHVRKLQG